ncbi:21361_t:CDS:2, partial [Racocetra persica]
MNEKGSKDSAKQSKTKSPTDKKEKGAESSPSPEQKKTASGEDKNQELKNLTAEIANLKNEKLLLAAELKNERQKEKALSAMRADPEVPVKNHLLGIEMLRNIFRLYELVEEVENDNLPAGTVVKVVAKGYLLADQVLRPARNIRRFFSPSVTAPSVADTQTSIEIINDKIKLIKGTNKNKINVVAYQKYFNFLEKLGLQENFRVITTYDELTLDVTLIRPLLINKNNNKLGYQVVSYDARNHGLSGKSATALGQIEACDLQDIITWVKEKYRPEKIGLY